MTFLYFSNIIAYSDISISLFKVFRPPGRVPFCTNRKEPKNRQGAASEQTTALPPRSAMPLSPWTPEVTTRAFSTVIASYARRGAAVELTSFLRRCRSWCSHCEKLRCSHHAPGFQRTIGFLIVNYPLSIVNYFIVTNCMMSSRMAIAALRAASLKSWPSPPVFCQAHMMPREELMMAPFPYWSKACFTSSAVPP